jgi:hypothetical protein
MPVLALADHLARRRDDRLPEDRPILGDDRPQHGGFFLGVDKAADCQPIALLNTRQRGDPAPDGPPARREAVGRRCAPLRHSEPPTQKVGTFDRKIDVGLVPPRRGELLGVAWGGCAPYRSNRGSYRSPGRWLACLGSPLRNVGGPGSPTRRRWWCGGRQPSPAPQTKVALIGLRSGAALAAHPLVPYDDEPAVCD